MAVREKLKTRAELTTKVLQKALDLRPQAAAGKDLNVLELAMTDAHHVADATEAGM